MDKRDLDMVLSQMRLLGVAAVLAVAYEREETPFRRDDFLLELEEIESMLEVPRCLH